MAFQCGLFQLSFSSGVAVYPASFRWVAQWYPSVHWVNQWHSSGIPVYTGPASVHWLRVRGDITDPLDKHGLTLISAWIRNYTHSKMKDKITYLGMWYSLMLRIKLTDFKEIVPMYPVFEYIISFEVPQHQSRQKSYWHPVIAISRFLSGLILSSTSWKNGSMRTPTKTIYTTALRASHDSLWLQGITGEGVTKAITPVPLCSSFIGITKTLVVLDITHFGYHVHLWLVSPQLSCRETCEIWTWSAWLKISFFTS